MGDFSEGRLREELEKAEREIGRLLDDRKRRDTEIHRLRDLIRGLECDCIGGGEPGDGECSNCRVARLSEPIQPLSKDGE